MLITKNERIIIAWLVSAKRQDIEDQVENISIYFTKAGAQIVGRIVQKRGISRSRKAGGVKHMDKPINSKSVLGKGKTEELIELCNQTNATLVVFLNALSEAQQERLSNMTNCRVESLST